ncbi:MAG: VOC family protein [Armatimonadaceae bacterium]
MTPRIGHVHLKVRDLERAVTFYQDLLDFQVTERVGKQYAFLSGGEMHHEIALQAVGPNAPAPAPQGVGLYHTAFELPDRVQFAEAVRRLQEHSIPYAAVDHGISWALYLNDPDGNGVEIYLDRRHTPEGTGRWAGNTFPLTDANIFAK